MKISEMIPYERNAWNNEEGVPAIAQSIKDFGFRGQIKLWKRDNPVIISGHHRVKALKLLGWEELPDEHIQFCEDMTEQDVKAFRLADNRTGQTGKWNKGLEKAEIKSLTKMGVDMSKYKFDFKSKHRIYGAERFKTDDYYNLGIVSNINCKGRYDMPVVKGTHYVPDNLLAFNYAKTSNEFDYGIHFFIDDYQFERLWNSPEKYLELLKKFDCVLTPDFSLYMDMPLPMQQWNEYRRRALGNFWQRNGIEVIPTLSWSDQRSYGFCFDGLPKYSTVATSTVGVKRDEHARTIWCNGMKYGLERLQPSCVLVYGGNIDFDFGNTKVVEYKVNSAFER